jgi:hypothetical protein
MDVLVLESEAGVADSTVQKLEQRGHDVLRCHEPGKAAFPCRALAGDGPCPLNDPGVDVAVTVRAHPDVQPSAREDGVACALRARVSLVVAGDDILSPYDDWAAEIVRDDGDVVGACERVLAAPSGDHSEVATDALREALRRRTGSAGHADAVVWRDRKGLRVRLEGVEDVDDSSRGIVAADVAAALRAFDPVTPKIDIGFS